MKKRAGASELKYWRKKNSGLEVDFVIEGYAGQDAVPVEVRWKSFDTPRVPRSLHSFLQEYPAPLAVVVNKNLFTKVRSGKSDVWFIPVWMAL